MFFVWIKANKLLSIIQYPQMRFIKYAVSYLIGLTTLTLKVDIHFYKWISISKSTFIKVDIHF